MIANTVLAALVLLIPSALGHGAIVGVAGANGVQGQGFGVDAATPRDGSRRRPFQQDSSILREETGCGRTLAGGDNNVAAGMAQALAAGGGQLPEIGPNGQITMTLHQVNGDGAGPYVCGVSADATGNNFVAMQVMTQVPGERSRSDAEATAFPLVAQMPAGMTCTGGANGNACIVRCNNDARAGPFGGCVAVQQAQAQVQQPAVQAGVAQVGQAGIANANQGVVTANGQIQNNAVDQAQIQNNAVGQAQNVASPAVQVANPVNTVVAPPVQPAVAQPAAQAGANAFAETGNQGGIGAGIRDAITNLLNKRNAELLEKLGNPFVRKRAVERIERRLKRAVFADIEDSEATRQAELRELQEDGN